MNGSSKKNNFALQGIIERLYIRRKILGTDRYFFYESSRKRKDTPYSFSSNSREHPIHHRIHWWPHTSYSRGQPSSESYTQLVLRAAAFLNSYRRDQRSQWTSQNLQGGLYWTCENQLVPTSSILLIGGKPGRDRTIPHEIKQLANYKTNHSRDKEHSDTLLEKIFFLFLARDRLLYSFY